MNRQTIKSHLGGVLRWHFIGPAMWGLMACAFEIISPWCLVQAIDRGIAKQAPQALAMWLGGAAVLWILAGFLRYASRCGVAHVGLEIEKNRLNQYFKRVMHADIRLLPDLSHGLVMGQILFAASSERAFAEAMYAQGLPILAMSIGSFIALLALSPILACLSFILCPLAGALWFWMRRKIRPAARLEYECKETLYRRFIDAIRALITIRSLHRTDSFCEAFAKQSELCADAGMSLQKRQAVQGPFFDILQAVVMVIVFGAGGFMALDDQLSIGILLGFQVYLGRLFGLMRSGTGLFGTYQQYLEGRARAHEIENLSEMPPAVFGQTAEPELLRIEHLRFCFGERVIWPDENLVIGEGEKKAILLPSGAGKTTLARCILGLYRANGGTISIPDGDSSQIGFVPQENVLFDGSLRDNIALTNPDLDDVSFAKLIEICGLDKVHARLGNTSIGEMGARLSGGEQRRVMLARALSNRPKLLIIDQMASELEPELCRQIFDQLSHAFPRLGILYLGHRAPEW